MRFGPRACAIVGVGMLCAAGWLPLRLGAQRGGMFQGSADDPAIAYTTAPVNNVVEDLTRKLQAGSAGLRFDGRAGYLQSVIESLKLPIDSQLLVFSKTSLQRQIITSNRERCSSATAFALAWVRTAICSKLPTRRERVTLLFPGAAPVDVQSSKRFRCLAQHEPNIGCSRSSFSYDVRQAAPMRGATDQRSRSTSAGAVGRHGEQWSAKASWQSFAASRASGGVESWRSFDRRILVWAVDDMKTPDVRPDQISTADARVVEARAADPVLHQGVLRHQANATC